MSPFAHVRFVYSPLPSKVGERMFQDSATFLRATAVSMNFAATFSGASDEAAGNGMTGMSPFAHVAFVYPSLPGNVGSRSSHDAPVLRRDTAVRRNLPATSRACWSNAFGLTTFAAGALAGCIAGSGLLLLLPLGSL